MAVFEQAQTIDAWYSVGVWLGVDGVVGFGGLDGQAMGNFEQDASSQPMHRGRDQLGLMQINAGSCLRHHLFQVVWPIKGEVWYSPEPWLEEASGRISRLVLNASKQ